jgi:hypothetical protein
MSSRSTGMPCLFGEAYIVRYEDLHTLDVFASGV